MMLRLETDERVLYVNPYRVDVIEASSIAGLSRITVGDHRTIVIGEPADVATAVQLARELP